MAMKLSQIQFCDFVYLLKVVFLVKVLHNWLFTRYCMMNFSRHCAMAFSGYCMRTFLLKISYFKLSWATLCSKNWLLNLSKSNRLKTLFILCVLENFAKLTRKHRCRSVFYNEYSLYKRICLLKRRLCRLFSCKFSRIFKNNFSTDTSGRMLFPVIFHLGSGELLRKI